MSSITLNTGAPGSGKSTVARAVATRFARCLVINVDQLRDMMVSGQSTPDMGVTDELCSQCRRSRAAAIHMARINADEGVEVIIDDVCVPEMFADHYAERFSFPDSRGILLMPRRQVQKERIKQRKGPWDHVLVEHIDWLYDYLEPMPKDGWTVLDTGDWTIDRTVDEVSSLICRGGSRPGA